MALMLGP